MSRNRVVGLVVFAVATTSALAFSTLTFGESSDSQCWDEYNGGGTRKTGRLVTAKGGDPDDCTPALKCFDTYNGDRTKIVRRLVPMGANPKTACRELPPTTTVAPTTTVPVPTSDRFSTLPVGASLPGDQQCAAAVRPMTENRAANVSPNGTTGTKANDEFPRVTGAFTGTTDEILQWVSCKWGVDEDHVRAQVALESNWQQTALGLAAADSSAAVGLGQVTFTGHPSAFVDQNAERSSAYNLDYVFANWRSCFEGATTWVGEFESGKAYKAGDSLGCMGMWHTGRWYTDAATAYMDRWAQTLDSRPWAQPAFPPAFPLSGPPSTVAPTTTAAPTTTVAPTTTAVVTIAPTTTTATTTTAAPTTTAVPTTSTPVPTTSTPVPTTSTPVPTTSTPTTVSPPSGSANFLATFDTPAGFYDRFDYGFSGQDPAFNTSVERLTSWQGDHDAGCGSPDSQRTISVERNTNQMFGGTYEDFNDMFWSCRGHLMTGASTVGYNIAWFSPKPLFTNVTRVCWDINLTDIASRKWTQVMFVSEADSLRNPSARGSGGFDLGYGNPIFQDPNGVNAGVFPQSGDLAGMQTQQGGFVRWFENQTQWTTEYSAGGPMTGNFDKATRYTHCIEQLRPGTIRVTQERPASHGGFQQHDMPGTIPRGPLRVVFQDDNYNGPKSENHNPNFNTWHWDNIVVETG